MDEPLPVRPEYGDDQLSFRGKVMMNTGFADMNGFGDIGIAECRVSEITDQGVGGLEDVACGISLHADQTTD